MSVPFASLGSVVVDRSRIQAFLRAEPLAEPLTKTALRVETKAKMLCPVDTGRLRSSITHAVGKDVDGVFGVVGTNVEYAFHVEYGTYRARAQPFLRPALESVVREGITS